MSQVLLMANSSHVSFPFGRSSFGTGFGCGQFDIAGVFWVSIDSQYEKTLMVEQ